MIKLPEFEVTADNVSRIVSKYKDNYLPRLQKLWNYYDGQTKILDRKMQNGKPNNKMANEYCKYITDITSGYFLGINIKYNSNNKEYLEEYSGVVEDNFEEDENYELAKNASIYGFATEVLYQNEEGLTRFKRLDPRETILIFSTRIDSYLIGAISYYVEKTLDNKKTEIAEVYTESEVIRFEKIKSGKFKEVSRYSHYFREIPIILYKNNEEMKSDFEGVITLNDSYDKSQSDTANDFEYFTDAYLIISGKNGLEVEDGNYEDDERTNEEKAYSNMRNNKVMFFPEQGDAKFLIKDINDTATENYKNRINSDIHKFSMTPDMSDEKFAGNLSGIAIEYKILPLEQRTKVKENKFRTGLKKRRELITNIINIRKGTDYDYREITEEFTRNIPQNTVENTEMVLNMADYISRRTLLELLPQIKDVDQELERIKEDLDEDDKREYNNFENTDIEEQLED